MIRGELAYDLHHHRHMTDGTNLPRASFRLSGTGARRIAMTMLLDRVGSAQDDMPGPWMGALARPRVAQNGVEVAVEYGGLGYLSTADAARYAPVIAAVGSDGVTAYARVQVRELPGDEVEVVVSGNGLTAEPAFPVQGKAGVNLPVLLVYLVLLAGAITVAALVGGLGRVVAGVVAAVLLVLGGALFGTGVVFQTMFRSIDKSMEHDRFPD